MSNNTSLFDDFKPVSAEAWKQKIQLDLKGADYNEALVWESPEGISVKPFYHSDDKVNVPRIEKSTPGWLACQTIYVDNDSSANEKAKKALQKGAESVQFVIPSDDISIEILLSDIDIRKTLIYFEFQCFSLSLCKSIFDYVDDAHYDNMYLNIDIVGHLARSGNWITDLNKDFQNLSELLHLNAKNILSVDVSLYQNAGATIVQQLAYALAHANEYLNAYSSQNNNIGSMHFKVAIGTNYFFEIAKLRALRWLWRTLANEYNIGDESCHIIATPTKRNKTLYDYNTNMLRTTTECMSAVLGRADTVCNMPYDAIYHKNNAFGERISLNQLLLLKNESYFDKVNNVADGAYYIETLTKQLAEKALDLFKNIEKEGGFLKQLENGIIQQEIRKSASKEQERFHAEEEVLVGTNKYPNDTDKMKGTIDVYPFAKTDMHNSLIEPIIERRLAEAIEQKRLNDE